MQDAIAMTLILTNGVLRYSRVKRGESLNRASAQRQRLRRRRDDLVAGNRDNGHGDNGMAANGRTGNGSGAGGLTEDGSGANGATEAADADVARPQPRSDTWGTDGSRWEPAVVFVLDPDGQFHAREIVTGVRDWETTEVLGGLEGGEELVLLPSTSLLRSQQNMRDRFARRSTVVPTGGR